MSETIKCLNCENDSEIVRDEKEGINAFKIHDINWIAKNPFVYNGDNNWCYYCSKECKEAHYSNFINLSDEERKSGSKILESIKEVLTPNK